MDTALQLALETAINPYVSAQVAIEHQKAEDAFLNGRFGQEFLGLQRMTLAPKETTMLWTQPGNVGNDPGKIGPGQPVAGYGWSPGETATLIAKAPSTQWANVYLYMKLPTPTALPRRLVDSRTFLIQDLSGWQALEFQSQVAMGGLTYNMAWQANFVQKRWRYFDYTNTKWIEVPLAASVSFPDFTKPVTLAAEFALDGQSTTHVALTINGTRYAVGIRQAATAKNPPDKLTTAVQIDPKPAGSCSLQISQHDVRYL
jgi:hypothetical protein